MDNFELRRRALLKNIAVSIVKLIVTSANGIVNFTTNLIHAVKIVCDFVPIQAGTGDPSPDNVRSISGITSANIYKADNNLLQPKDGNYYPCFIPAGNWFTVSALTQSNVTFRLYDENKVQKDYFFLQGNPDADGYKRRDLTRSYDIYYISFDGATIHQVNWGRNRLAYNPPTASKILVDWTNEAGTVYGGTLAINEDGSGTLVSKYKQIYVGDLNYTLNTGLTNVDRYYVAINDSKSYGVSDLPDVICEAFKTMTLAQANSSSATWAFGFQSRTVYFYVPKDTYSSINDFKSAFAITKFVYALDNPVTYNLTALQVNSLLGTNNIWHNMNGAITVEYYNKQ